METIMCVSGNSTIYGDMYKPDDSWYGKILLGKDHKFEGYVHKYDDSAYYLVFGEMSFNKINLIQLSEKDSNIPYLFSGKREGKRFYGDYYATDEFNQIPLGECMISIMYEEDIKEASNRDKRFIKMITADLKKDLGERGQKLLNNFEEVRKEETIKSNKTI